MAQERRGWTCRGSPGRRRRGAPGRIGDGPSIGDGRIGDGITWLGEDQDGAGRVGRRRRLEGGRCQRDPSASQPCARVGQSPLGVAATRDRRAQVALCLPEGTPGLLLSALERPHLSVGGAHHALVVDLAGARGRDVPRPVAPLDRRRRGRSQRAEQDEHQGSDEQAPVMLMLAWPHTSRWQAQRRLSRCSSRCSTGPAQLVGTSTGSDRRAMLGSERPRPMWGMGIGVPVTIGWGAGRGRVSGGLREPATDDRVSGVASDP